MAALLGNGNADDATSQFLQDKMKKMTENFNNYSANSLGAQVPAPRVVRIEEPARVAPTNSRTASASIPLHQVTPVQPRNQRACAGDVGDMSP
jgi:hypothetical protein